MSRDLSLTLEAPVAVGPSSALLRAHMWFAASGILELVHLEGRDVFPVSRRWSVSRTADALLAEMLAQGERVGPVVAHYAESVAQAQRDPSGSGLSRYWLVSAVAHSRLAVIWAEPDRWRRSIMLSLHDDGTAAELDGPALAAVVDMLSSERSRLHPHGRW